uniref:Uncharacterized protein n=1 Tax=Compsopogon caeruleus TaxID=31354 RepID=A0A6T6CP96_9RHOD|mmetsp:Transcript_6657/g.13516  ORF Transcript_6657/g.13516 Transcript_6657/m.13516 type:complete len:420 (+) Transcript_6657:776-2035(+)
MEAAAAEEEEWDLLCGILAAEEERIAESGLKPPRGNEEDSRRKVKPGEDAGGPLPPGSARVGGKGLSEILREKDGEIENLRRKLRALEEEIRRKGADESDGDENLRLMQMEVERGQVEIQRLRTKLEHVERELEEAETRNRLRFEAPQEKSPSELQAPLSPPVEEEHRVVKSQDGNARSPEGTTGYEMRKGPKRPRVRRSSMEKSQTPTPRPPLLPPGGPLVNHDDLRVRPVGDHVHDIISEVSTSPLSKFRFSSLRHLSHHISFLITHHPGFAQGFAASLADEDNINEFLGPELLSIAEEQVQHSGSNYEVIHFLRVVEGLAANHDKSAQTLSEGGVPLAILRMTEWPHMSDEEMAASLDALAVLNGPRIIDGLDLGRLLDLVDSLEVGILSSLTEMRSAYIQSTLRRPLHPDSRLVA